MMRKLKVLKEIWMEFTQETSIMDYAMGKANFAGTMASNLLANGKMEWKMGLENGKPHKGIFMKEIGEITNRMDKEYTGINWVHIEENSKIF